MQLLTIVCFFAARLAVPFVLRLSRKQPMLAGITFQMFVIVASLATCLLGSLAMESELVQHRTFFVVFSTNLFISDRYAHLPFGVCMSMRALVMFITWLLFHWHVG